MNSFFAVLAAATLATGCAADCYSYFDEAQSATETAYIFLAMARSPRESPAFRHDLEIGALLLLQNARELHAEGERCERDSVDGVLY